MNQTKHLIYDYIKDDELELDRLMDDFEGYIRAIIKNMSNDNLSYEDKEEILSDTFFILWKNKEKINTSVEAYVAGITRIFVKEKLRKRKITYDISEYENIISDFDEVEEDILENEIISKSINGLKKKDIEILMMFYYHSKSTKEIAEKLNLSEINVRSRLFRIRNKIRKELNS